MNNLLLPNKNISSYQLVRKTLAFTNFFAKNVSAITKLCTVCHDFSAKISIEFRKSKSLFKVCSKIDLTKTNKHAAGVFLVFPHCTWQQCAHCGNYGILHFYAILSQKFRQINFFTKHSVEKCTKKRSRQKIFRENTHPKSANSTLTNACFLPLGGISVSNWWNVLYRAGFKLKFLHAEL